MRAAALHQRTLADVTGEERRIDFRKGKALPQGQGPQREPPTVLGVCRKRSLAVQVDKAVAGGTVVHCRSNARHAVLEPHVTRSL